MRRSHFLVLFLLLTGLISVFAQEQASGQAAKQKIDKDSLAVIDVLDRPAIRSQAAAHSVLLDVTRAGNRLVAVGERGVVVLSDDSGRNWHQASVPTSVSLTAVKFTSPRIGWAVGHGGVVLHTEDAGGTWTRQLDGRILADLAVDSAQSLLNSAGSKKDAAQRLLADAQRLKTDGPDKPFLNLYFENDTSGFVVGAYGLVFHTEDAGKTWKPWMDRVENPRGMHIYSIAAAGKAIYMAGEQGLFLVSTDNGMKFTRVETPYKGTYFTLVPLPSGDVILGGMRGNAYRFSAPAKSFKQIAVPIPVSFSAATVVGNGNLVFANQAGQLLASTDSGQTIHPLPVALPPISGITDAGNGMLMTVGFAGAIPVPLNPAGAATGAGGLQ